MDDFMYVLLAALVVLAFAFIASSIGPWISPGSFQVPIINFSVGKIGVVTDVPTRTDSMGSFVVGEIQSEELRYVPQITVGASLFGGNVQKYEISIPDWYMESVKGASIKFNVYDTNMYGPLVITWNGLRVNGEVTDKGRREITIKSEYVKESNTLQVYAEGPGLLFWASTVYVLRDFRVFVDYGPRKLVPFQTLQSELEAFSKGEVTFYAADATSRLGVKVNGVGVYNATPKGFTSAEFDFVTVPLNPGTNIISFSSEGRVDLRDVALNLFLLTNEVVRVRRFNVTEDNYNLLVQGYKGKVEFKVETILREGNLNVRLNDRTIRVSDVETGINTVNFDKDDIHSGENEIEFSGTGGFQVGTAAVSIGPGF